MLEKNEALVMLLLRMLCEADMYIVNQFFIMNSFKKKFTFIPFIS